MKNFSKEYGKALYSLASDDNIEDGMLKELEDISGLLKANPDYVKMLSNPDIKKDRRFEIIENTFRGKVHPYIFNFLSFLSDKLEVYLFTLCYEEFRGIYNLEHNILEVTAVTAVPLTEISGKKLTDKLENVTGKKIMLHNKVDPECIGGVKIICKGSQMDASIKSYFDNLRKAVI